MESQEAVLTGEEMEPCTREIDFEAWMAEEQERIFLLCRRLLRNRDEADSATQDVFVKAFKALEKYGPSSIQEPPKWLTRVAYNTCYDLLRSKKWRFWRSRSTEIQQYDLLRTMPAAGPNQEETAEAKEICGRLEKALERLSIRQRAVFILRHEEMLGFAEIAETMDLDVGTIKAHMARAIKKLREELRDLYVR